MHVNKSFIFLWLAAITLLARSANGQTYGFYSGWSIDEQSGYVYMWAETAADYQISYYYDLYVCMQLVVTPGQGNPYSTCWTQDWSDDNWAYVECSTTVPLNSDIYLDSYHEANVTYYVYNFLPDCWEQGNCYNWWDANGMDFLGVDGQTFEDNISWFAPGPETPVPEQSTARGSLARRARLTTCPLPSGETSFFYNWNGGPGLWYIAQFKGLLNADPPGQSFNGRQVAETITPGVRDSCKFAMPDSPYSQWGIPGGGTWPVGQQYGNNVYGLDEVGVREDYPFGGVVTYYQDRIRRGLSPVTSCGWSHSQSMYINGCGGGQSTYYEPDHPLHFVINANAVTVTRSNASASR